MIVTLCSLWSVQYSHLCVSESGDCDSKKRSHSQNTVQCLMCTVQPAGWVETATARNILTVKTLCSLRCVQCINVATCVWVWVETSTASSVLTIRILCNVWPVINCWEWRLQHQEPCTRDTVHPLACVQSLRISVAAVLRTLVGADHKVPVMVYFNPGISYSPMQ